MRFSSGAEKRGTEGLESSSSIQKQKRRNTLHHLLYGYSLWVSVNVPQRLGGVQGGNMYAVFSMVGWHSPSRRWNTQEKRFHSCWTVWLDGQERLAARQASTGALFSPASCQPFGTECRTPVTDCMAHWSHAAPFYFHFAEILRNPKT